MGSKKFGSFFESILSKSPDAAKRLKEMAKSKPMQPKTHRVADAKEEKKAAAPSEPLPEAQGRGMIPGLPEEFKQEESAAQRKDANSEKPAAARQAAGKQTPVAPKLPTARAKAYPKRTPVARKPSPQINLRKQKAILKNRNVRFFDNIEENACQFVRDGNSQSLDIFAGFDFGTSSTKIVVRIPNWPSSPGFAVPFGDLAHSSLEYLLPTRLAIRKDGQCFLQAEKGASIFTDIKVGLMREHHENIESVSGPPRSVSAETVAAAYVALALRYVRCWFLANKHDIFGGFRLNWHWSLGLPAAIKDKFNRREVFERVGKAAWVASRRPGPITAAGVGEAIEDVKASRFSEDDMPVFELLPEVIAEVMGYARSTSRDEGLHLLIDVGASTLDICSFNLHSKDGEDHFPILTADIGFRGAKILHEKRIEGVRRAAQKWPRRFMNDDPVAAIPESCEDYAPSKEIICSEIGNPEKDFKAECQKLLGKTITDLRTRRDPHSARWSDSLPVFMCGGAGAMQIYRDVVDDAGQQLEKNLLSFQGISLKTLQKPESLADIGDGAYHRLAVAWGLSHGSFNIGEYDCPSEIEDIVPPVRKAESQYIGKEQV